MSAIERPGGVLAFSGVLTDADLDRIVVRLGELTSALADARRVIAKFHNSNANNPACPCVHCVAHRADQGGGDDA